ncbi:hypothetical protein ACHAW6_005330 [Cyclotella cf. meneghiniana]
MATVDYFLGTAFNWQHFVDGNLSILITQSTFSEYFDHRFAINTLNPVPNITPYCHGSPIDLIPPPDPKDPDQEQCTKCYKPSHQNYKSTLHVLKYLFSTSKYVISFHFYTHQTLQAFNHSPHHYDKEACTDATPPLPANVINSLHSVMLAGEANLEMHSQMALPLNSSSLNYSQAISSAVVKHHAINHCLVDTSKCMTIYNDNKVTFNWALAVTLRVTNTSISMRTVSKRPNKQASSQSNTYLVSSTPTISSQKTLKMMLLRLLHGLQIKFSEVWALCGFPYDF